MTEKLLREIWEDELTPKKRNLNAQKDLFEREYEDDLDYCVDGELWNPEKASK